LHEIPSFFFSMRILGLFFLVLFPISLHSAFALETPLSLSKAIDIALENNLMLRAEKEKVHLLKAAESIEAAQFDSTLLVNAKTKQQSRGITSLLETGFTAQQQIEQEEISFGLGWKKPMRWGGEYGLTLRPIRTDSTFQATHPTYQGDLFFSVNQPLLRGFGQTKQGRLKIAHTEVAISHQMFYARVAEMIQKIIFHYWELVFERENLTAQQASLERANTLLELNKTKVKLGLLAPIEILVAEVSVAKREESVIVAKKKMHDIEGELLSLLGGENAESRFPGGILPTDRPVDREIHFDQNDLFERAKGRPDIQAQALRIQTAALSFAIAKNQTRPTLDFIGVIGQNGVGQRLTESFDQLTSGDFYLWEAGLVFEYPLGNKAAHAALEKEKAAGNQVKIEVLQLIQQVRLDLSEGVRRIEADYQRILATRRALELAKKQHLAGEERFRLGLLAGHDLVAFQNEVVEAEVKALRAITDYNQSLANLDHVTGTLLDQYKVPLHQ